MEEGTTKIFGLKMFGYIVEEARGSNSNLKFQDFGLFRPWLAGWDSLT